MFEFRLSVNDIRRSLTFAVLAYLITQLCCTKLAFGQGSGDRAVSGGSALPVAFPNEDVLEEWKVLESKLFSKVHILATCEQIVFTESDGPEKPRSAHKQRWEVNLDGNNFLVRAAGENRPFSQVLGRNTNNAFEIGRPDEKAKWSISQFDRTKEQTEVVTRASDLVLDFLRSPYLILHRVPVRLLFESTAANRITATSSGHGQNQVITVNFEHHGNPSSDAVLDRINRGTIRFDPLRHWAILDYDVRTRPLLSSSKRVPVTRATQKCVYRSPRSIELSAVEYSISIPSKEPKVSRWNVTIDEIEKSTLEPNGYTLAAFDLPEPPVPTSQNSSWRWFWYLQAGFLLLLLSLLLRRRARMLFRRQVNK